MPIIKLFRGTDEHHIHFKAPGEFPYVLMLQYIKIAALCMATCILAMAPK